jgi:5-oxopent-3-ene-1,2,5-tricarboxylate decarboxylase/2-hydroxyhepta-2,4-diene-1,7-dioate isomerase
MRIGRFLYKNKVIEGIIEDNLVKSEGEYFEINSLKFLPPCEPRNIFGLVLNYADHADELGLKTSEEPIVFMKPTSSIVAHMESIIYPRGVNFLHYEGELAIVIGKDCRKVKANEVANYILGYTIANDVTARDFITSTFRPPIKAKGFDSFCPVGPWIVTLDEIGVNPKLDIETKVNGEIKQKSNTSLMIHTIPKIIEFLSSFTTLKRGDLILTGTPKGIHPLKPGDVVEITIEKIGTLKNFVVEEESI